MISPVNMKYVPVFAVILFTIACGESQLSPAHRPTAADIILTNGIVHTLDENEPGVEAIAITGNRITATGDAQTISALAGDDTRIIDLGGRTVMPGFHDLHVHPLFGGLSEVLCSVPQGLDLEQALQKIRLCAEKAGAGNWIIGGQWDVSALGQMPHRTMLDSVVSDQPVLLNDTSGHSAWVNSKALEIAELTRDTKDPEGGIIERDTTGEPTGILRESAIMLVEKHVPPHSDETVRSALQQALKNMLSVGITSFTEAAIGFNAGHRREVEAYASLFDAGQVKHRVRLCLTWKPDNEEAEAVISRRADYERDRVSLDCIKIFLDGVPTDSHTAAMLEPYEGTVEGRTNEASLRGLLLMEQEAINEAAARFDRMGIALKFHSAGDAAVRAGLKGIAHALEVNGPASQRHDVGHCTFVAKEDMAFARDIGATFEVSPYLWSPSPINDEIARAVGDARIQRVWPVREMIDSGALVVPGSDWAVVPSVNPWPAIEALVTREEPGGSEKSFGRQQAVSLDQAIQMFTINSARHLGNEDKLGRLRPGMLADIIVLDRDPYAIPVTELHKVLVDLTIIDGEIVYSVLP